MIRLNCSKKINEIEETLRKWRRRILTPIGKIVIVKNLLISKLNHLFLTLPNPLELDFRKLKTLLNTFVYGKSFKVKQSVMIKDYNQGGLKMINLEAFVNSLKITCIRRLMTSESKWTEIVKMYVDISKLPFCGQCFLELVSKKCTNNFWAETFNTLSKLIEKLSVKKERIFEYPLFFNPDIVVGFESTFIKSWFKAGINCIGDLVTINNTIMEYNEFKANYHVKSDYLTYQGIKTSLQKALKKYHVKQQELKQTPKPFFPPYLKALLNDSKGCKSVYTCLNNNNEIPTCIKKWDEILSTKFTEDDWEAIFLLPFSVTSDINIRWFQFRLIHRILGTNSYLYKINYVENSICTFCKQFPETIEHIFWTYRYSQALIRNMLLNHYNIYGDLTLNDMLSGFIESACKMKNLLLILFKMYILNVGT